MIGTRGVNIMKAFIEIRVLYKKEKESGKLKMSGGSWTINMDKFDLDIVDEIHYITEQYAYTIKTNDAKWNGFVKEFQGETKLIVAIKHWIRYALPIYKKLSKAC